MAPNILIASLPPQKNETALIFNTLRSKLDLATNISVSYVEGDKMSSEFHFQQEKLNSWISSSKQEMLTVFKLVDTLDNLSTIDNIQLRIHDSYVIDRLVDVLMLQDRHPTRYALIHDLYKEIFITHFNDFYYLPLRTEGVDLRSADHLVNSATENRLISFFNNVEKFCTTFKFKVLQNNTPDYNSSYILNELSSKYRIIL